MPFTVACTTNLGFAPPTFAISPPAIGTAGQVEMNLCWFDPRAAASGRAVDAVFSSILMIFLVPFPLECVGKQLFYVFQWDMIGCTACRRHVLWIRSRDSKDSFEAIVTHAVPAVK